VEGRSRKLDELNELQGLRKDVWRIIVAIEKLAGIESQDSEKEQFSWLTSEGEEIEMQESSGKEKQREEKIAGLKGENHGMEDVKEGSSNFSPVAFSVNTGAL